MQLNSTPGCINKSRSNSFPEYPLAPTTATFVILSSDMNRHHPAFPRATQLPGTEGLRMNPTGTKAEFARIPFQRPSQ
jgi:hypothetical protein